MKDRVYIKHYVLGSILLGLAFGEVSLAEESERCRYHIAGRLHDELPDVFQDILEQLALCKFESLLIELFRIEWQTEIEFMF